MAPRVARPGAAPRRHRAAGFIITLEFLLVMALFVVPVMVGMILLGRKLYTLYLDQRDFVEQPYSRAVVWDSSGTRKIVGPVLGYDAYEAPLVLFRDAGTNGGVILGVRRTRFTSYGQVFYTDGTCGADGGTPYVRQWNDDNEFVGSDGTVYTPTGFAYQRQQVSYAIGNLNVLYESTSTGGGNPSIGSVWSSQHVANAAVPGDGPCHVVPGADATLVTDLVAATQVIDFNAYYTPDFFVAFPTPSSAPALGAYANGEQ